MWCFRQRYQDKYACWCALLIKNEHGNEKKHQNGRIYFEIGQGNGIISRRKPEKQAGIKPKKNALKHYRQNINYQQVITK